MTRAAVMLDIGGTLWPDAFTEDLASRVHRLANELPETHRNRAAKLAKDLQTAADEVQLQADDDLRQDTLAIVERSLRRLAIPSRPGLAERIRAAMVVPASPGRLFPGALELLTTLRRRRVRVVAVSNTLWRRAGDYVRDFQVNDMGQYFAAIVTSLDEGVRKPHPLIFERALAIAGTSVERTIVVGNSERIDIAPAIRLGMRTVLVAIEQPPPPKPASDALVLSLLELRNVLVSWLDEF